MADLPTELSWFSAIVKVLQQAGAAMHYTDIADEITAKGFKSTLVDCL